MCGLAEQSVSLHSDAEYESSFNLWWPGGWPNQTIPNDRESTLLYFINGNVCSFITTNVLFCVCSRFLTDIVRIDKSEEDQYVSGQSHVTLDLSGILWVMIVRAWVSNFHHYPIKLFQISSIRIYLVFIGSHVFNLVTNYSSHLIISTKTNLFP